MREFRSAEQGLRPAVIEDVGQLAGRPPEGVHRSGLRLLGPAAVAGEQQQGHPDDQQGDAEVTIEGAEIGASRIDLAYLGLSGRPEKHTLRTTVQAHGPGSALYLNGDAIPRPKDLVEALTTGGSASASDT